MKTEVRRGAIKAFVCVNNAVWTKEKARAALAQICLIEWIESIESCREMTSIDNDCLLLKYFMWKCFGKQWNVFHETSSKFHLSHFVICVTFSNMCLYAHYALKKQIQKYSLLPATHTAYKKWNNVTNKSKKEISWVTSVNILSILNVLNLRKLLDLRERLVNSIQKPPKWHYSC